MSDFVRPDHIYRVPMEGGSELQISPSIDFLHTFPNGAWVLKYYDPNNEPPRFCNIFMSEESAMFLIEHCEVEAMDRQFMGAQEHEQYLGWAATFQLSELDFDIGEDNG